MPETVLIWTIGFAAGVILIVLLALIFKSDLQQLIGRLRKVKFPYGSLETDPIKQPEQRNPDDAPAGDSNPLLTMLDNPVIREVEDRIRNNADFQRASDDRKRVDGLVRHLAAATIALEFERIYLLIFGSQINLLRLLAEYTHPVPIEGTVCCISCDPDLGSVALLPRSEHPHHPQP
jgi:hypothetical protein